MFLPASRLYDAEDGERRELGYATLETLAEKSAAEVREGER